MRRRIASLLQGLGYELGSGRARANVGRDLLELERALASVDALAARLAACTAYGRAA
ncbi:MAG: hypothetical protein ACRDV7_06575 [Acidimicrobiia bacterium]|jgi:hypothetical protein